MKLAETTLHRFGALENRHVGPFGDGLNVVFGPNEAGKTTLFRFVRGTLHGFSEAHREGLLPPEPGRAPGWLLLDDDGRDVRAERVVDGGPGRITSMPPLAKPPSFVEPLAFFDPYEPGTLTTLIARVTEHGIDLHTTARPTADLDALRSTLERRSREVVSSLRSRLDRLRTLATRREELERRTQRLVAEHETRCGVLTARRDERRASLDDARTERERLEAELARLRERREDIARERCRRATETERLVDERLDVVADLDARIERIRNVLGDLDERAAELDAAIERHRTLTAPPGNAARAVHALEVEVERLTAHRSTCRHCGGGHESTCCDGVRSAAETLRERVYRLGELVDRQELEARALSTREELRELDCCRRGLRSQNELLSARRATEWEALAATDAFRLLAAGPASNSLAAEFCRCDRHRAYLADLRTRLPAISAGWASPTVESRSTVAPHETFDATSLEADLATRERRIEELADRITRQQAALADLERELAGLATSPSAEDDEATRLDLELEFTRLDFRRQSERYRTLHRQLAITRDLAENALLRCESVVLTEAAAHLRRLTLGHCHDLRTSEARRLEVRTAARGWLADAALGTGTRHLVGLAVRLAVAGELRRRGEHVPLFLDDVLVDNDLDRQSAAVALLADEAAAGQQIVLLTCHLHLREACRAAGGHVLDLPPRRGHAPTDDERTRTRRTNAHSGSTTLPRPPLVPDARQPTPAARPLLHVSGSESNTPASIHRFIATGNGAGTGRGTANRLGRNGDAGHGRGTPNPNAGGANRSHDNGSARGTAAASDRKLRFHLARSSPVVDAPSIGPKMATRLKRLGIRTVDDLLDANADDVATRLNRRHVTPDVVREWQAQARLCCCIPEIRGHDAQILVACGIDTPQAVAATEPRALLATVAPFCESSAGKRILRSGKAPDLAEVTDWIHWSRQSRTLKAA